MTVQVVRPGGDEGEIAVLDGSVLGGQHEMGQEGEVRTGVDVSRSIVLSQSLPASSEHAVPHQTHGTSKRTPVCLQRKKQM